MNILRTKKKEKKSLVMNCLRPVNTLKCKEITNVLISFSFPLNISLTLHFCFLDRIIDSGLIIVGVDFAEKKRTLRSKVTAGFNRLIQNLN